MKLGLKRDEVLIVPHNEEWEHEFIKIQAELITHTRLSKKQIEHIGSTAIKGIKAKPIIDILIGVKDISSLENSFFEQLKMAGFYRLRVQKKDEIICAKFTDDSFEIKTHIIHIVEMNQEKWQQLILFRDILKENKEIRFQYEELKDSFFESTQTGIDAYTDYKELFVKKVIENARM